jgi:hypothetical protein
METPTVSKLVLIGLLAVVPVVAYAFGRGSPVIAISLVSVLLIAGALYLMVGPSQSEVNEHLLGR